MKINGICDKVTLRNCQAQGIIYYFVCTKAICVNFTGKWVGLIIIYVVGTYPPRHWGCDCRINSPFLTGEGHPQQQQQIIKYAYLRGT